MRHKPYILWSILRSLWQRRKRKREIDEELRFHLEQRTADYLAAGMAPEDAAREARKRFGNLQSIREDCRGRLTLNWLDIFYQDLRLGVRQYVKQPGTFLATFAALTLGIGLVTFALSALDCVFLGKLPFPDAGRLAYVTIPPGQGFRDFQAQQKTFEGICAFGSKSMNFKAVNAPSRRSVCSIGANFLELVRVTPLLGRGFLPGEAQPGAEPVALIGYDLWQREYRGATSVLGSMIRLDGIPRTIVGVMPPGFKFPIDDELWMPAEPGTAAMTGWGFGFGRLNASATFADARLELNLIARRLELTGEDKSLGSSLRRPIMVGPYARFLADFRGAQGPGPAVFALLVVTLLVLGIACANVASLTLANATRRRTELAVRAALGATRMRLISQLLIESSILAVSGAGGALLTIALLSRGFARWFAANESQFSQIPFWMHIQIDGRLLLALVVLTLLATLLAGFWPSLQATRRDVNGLLQAHTGGTGGPRGGRLQGFLIILQIAFSLVVLTQSLILLDFNRRLKRVELPFNPSDILTARVDVMPSVDARLFFDQLEQNLTRIPGVEAIALSSSDPTSGHRWDRFVVEGMDYPRPEDQPSAGFDTVSAGYFRLLHLGLIAGRDFDPGDRAGSVPVAIVNASFAKRFLPPGDPVGRRIREGTNVWMTVVGCVPDLEFDPSATAHDPICYRPVSLQPSTSMVVLLRADGPPFDRVQPLRAEVARLQPDLAIYRIATIGTLMLHQVFGYHLASLLLGGCGSGSLFLATLGIVGLINLSVSQRTREIGVRLALGATRRRMVAVLLERAVWQMLAGLTAGVVLAFALNQLLTHTIADYPAVRHPGWMLVVAAAFLAAIGFSAVLIPAIRGARLDPMVTLRYE